MNSFQALGIFGSLYILDRFTGNIVNVKYPKRGIFIKEGLACQQMNTSIRVSKALSEHKNSTLRTLKS